MPKRVHKETDFPIGHQKCMLHERSETNGRGVRSFPPEPLTGERFERKRGRRDPRCARFGRAQPRAKGQGVSSSNPQPTSWPFLLWLLFLTLLPFSLTSIGPSNCLGGACLGIRPTRDWMHEQATSFWRPFSAPFSYGLWSLWAGRRWCGSIKGPSATSSDGATPGFVLGTGTAFAGLFAVYLLCSRCFGPAANPSHRHGMFGLIHGNLGCVGVSLLRRKTVLKRFFPNSLPKGCIQTG